MINKEANLVCQQIGRHNFDELRVGGKCVRCGISFEALQKEKDLRLGKITTQDVDLSKKRKKRKICHTNFRAARYSTSLKNYE